MSANKIIVEITSAQMHKPVSHVYEKKQLMVGRSYDCDIILDDDFVSPHHIEIFAQDDPMRFDVRDLASDNGTIFDGKKICDSDVTVVSGEEVKIGKTRVRILSASHPIAPTRRVNFGSKLQGLCDRFVVVLVLLLLGTLLGVLSDWHISDPKDYFDEDVYKLVAGYIALPLVFALVASFMRILSHKKVYFNREMSVWCVLMMPLTLSDVILPYIYFSAQTITVQNIMSMILVTVFCVVTTLYRSYIYDGRTALKTFLSSVVIGAFLSSSVLIPNIDYNAEPQYPSQMLVHDGAGLDLETPEAFLDRSSDLFSSKSEDIDESAIEE